MTCRRSWMLAAVVLPLAGGPDETAPPASVADGLERIATAYADWPSARPFGPCPLIDGEVIDDALGVAGIDARLGGWELFAVDSSPARVTCRGEYVGELGDEQFPEVVVELTAEVANDGAEVPPTDCERTTLLVKCTGGQAHDGVVVNVLIEDRVFVDAPTTDAVLDEVVPGVIGSLSGAAAELADPLAGIDAAMVAAAAAPLDAAIADVEGSSMRADCPLLDREELEAAVAGVGLDGPLDDWGAATRELAEPDGVTVLECGGDSDGDASRDSFGSAATVQLAAFDDPASAADFVASVGLPEGGSASDLPPGDSVLRSCLDAGSLGDVCTAWWWRDELVVGLWLLSDSERITATDAEAALIAIVPAVIDGLLQGG